MSKLHSLLPILVLSIWLAACGGTDQPDSADAPAATEQPAIEADVEVVQIEATSEGFKPDRIELEEGVPTLLVFTRTTGSRCAEKVHSPDLGIPETELPEGETVEFEITPTETGEFAFLCGMDMLEGTIVVPS